MHVAQVTAELLQRGPAIFIFYFRAQALWLDVNLLLIFLCNHRYMKFNFLRMVIVSAILTFWPVPSCLGCKCSCCHECHFFCRL